MTKFELIERFAKENNLKKSEAEKYVNSVIKLLSEAIAKEERVFIPGFGVFNIRVRKARKGRNPKTGKEITIPERKVVAFTAAKVLKEAIQNQNQKKK